MNTVLGLLGVAIFVPLIISLAAGLTWTVVRLSPTPQDDTTKTPTASS